MNENASRMVKTAIIGAILAIVVMVFNIWTAYGACSAAGLDSYTVEALNMEIYTITKSGSELVGNPNLGNMAIVVMIFMAVLALVNEISHKTNEATQSAKKKSKKQSKKNKNKKK